jgi:hypothetical protein
MTHNPPVVSYEIDAQRGGVLHDDDTFATERALDITYERFNPLLMSYSSEQTAVDDSAQKAIDQFLPALLATAKQPVPVPPEQPSGSDAEALRSTTDNCTDQALRIRDAVYARQVAVQKAMTAAEKKAKKTLSPTEYATNAFRLALATCVRCAELERKVGLLSVITTVERLEFTEATLSQWVGDATGLAGVVRTRIKVEQEIVKWKENREKAAKLRTDAQELAAEITTAIGARRQAEQELEDLIGGFANLEKARFATCGTFASDQLDEIRAIPARAQAVVDRSNSLIEALNTILAVLTGAEQKRWRNNDMDVVIDTPEPSPAQGKRVKVTLKAIKFSLDKAKNTITRATGIEATRTFDVRRHRRLVTEYGIAGVYNDLRYPKYSVKEEASVRTVAREFDTSNVNLAATLNFLCSACIGSGVYPGFQLGVSQAKDYPGLLGGGVLRFGGATRLSIASGVMITWYKDLNKLTVGGPVESEDKLKNDLKLRRSPAAWYLAVQYTFK